jgi:hypothetical protein
LADATHPNIDWADATREHLLALQQFTCTTPVPRTSGGRRLMHPKPYELVAQAVIRNLKPPVSGMNVVQLGLIAGQIATVASFTYLADAGQLAPIVFINAVGLTVDYRGGDGYVADETLRRVLIRTGLDLSEQGYQGAVAAGNIHDANTRSQALVERAGFHADGPRGDGYQQWTYAFSW